MANAYPHYKEELRYEIKFTVSAHRLAQARAWLRLHPVAFRTAYPTRWINSLYLDTPDLNSYSANVEGVSQRQKLRLRWYGALQSLVQRPVLEIKLKDNLVGSKKRQQLDLTLDLTRPFPTLLPQIRSGVAPQWAQWLHNTTQAALLTRYRRDYLVSPDGVLRATLDYDLVQYDQRLAVSANLSRPLPPLPLIVIELKAGLTHFQRLQDAAAALPLPRARSSKYASGLFAALQ